MFTTFDITTPGSLSSDKQPSPPSQPRPKRAQVSRACDWCRLTRVKCDSVRPCRNCKQAKRECVNSGRDDFKSVAAATKEVQRLRAQVHELEAKLMTPTPSNEKSIARRTRTPRWKGTRVNGLQYGPSSLTYFIHRLSTFMKTHFEPQFPSTPAFSTPSDRGALRCDRLQREQQDALLDLYWQGYHAIYPVFDEADFRRHYDSLWDGPETRRACPLVDIVIALCIQFGSSYMASDMTAIADKPGYGFYLQAQQWLNQDLEEPSLRTVQCHFLSAIYLLAFDQVNSAYMVVGTAVRTAESLGLPYDDDCSEESSLTNPGRRLRTCLTILDTQLALYLGRPFAIQEPQLHSHLGAEPDHIAHLVGPTFSLASPSSINWLHFQHERRRLFQTVREIHTELMTVCEDVLGEIDAPDFYQHPASREKCAQYLSQQLKRLKDWVDQLPEDLKTRRQQGVPFSVDRSPLNISEIDPVWLQRQRLILELEYHSLTIMLARSFNSFLPTPALGTFSSDNHCILSVNSAVMITNMLNQVVSDTGILTGWYQLIDWQRTASFALAGFACGYPICSLSPAARKALTRAASVFEKIGSQDMMKLASNLREKCLERVQAFCARLGIVTPVTTPADSKEGQSSDEMPDESSVPGSYEVMSIGEEGLANFGLDSLLSDSAWAGETPSTLLWGDLMRDLDTGLASSLGHVGVGEP